MKCGWMIMGGLIVLVAIVFRQQMIEGFGLFGGGDEKIPYDTLLKDIFSPEELAEFKKNVWDKWDSAQRDAVIAAWDNTSSKEQNKQYKEAVERAKKRNAVATALG
jgi:hypothetical protein